MKEMIDSQALIKFKTFTLQMKMSRELQDKPQIWRIYLQKINLDKRLLSKIYKELINLNNKTI